VYDLLEMIFPREIRLNWLHQVVAAVIEWAVVDFVYFHALLYIQALKVVAVPIWAAMMEGPYEAKQTYYLV
jgi:hypothetical protein